MSYLNNQIGYREELLATRSVVRKENFVLLEPDGLVKNKIPGYDGCDQLRRLSGHCKRRR